MTVRFHIFCDIFEDKHDLEKGHTYFDPDYDMAESFRRLRTNDDIQPHDIILLRHEALEFDIMQANPKMSYDEAIKWLKKYMIMQRHFWNGRKVNLMLKYELLENTSDYVKYKYYPEGKEKFGTITVKKADKSIIDKTPSVKNELSWYWGHMYKRIKEFIENDEFRSDGTVAWY